MNHSQAPTILMVRRQLPLAQFGLTIADLCTLPGNMFNAAKKEMPGIMGP